MATKKKQKRAAAKTATNRPARPKAPELTDEEFCRRFREYNKEQRKQEKLDPGDAETRRRILSAVCNLTADRFASFADLFEYISTEDHLGQVVLDMYGPVERELGMARMAEIFAAVLHRFEHTAGTDDRDEQLADDLVRAVKAWAYGDMAPPAGELVSVKPGMRANGCPASMNEADGLVVSTTPHGCFVKDDKTGEIVGLDWNTTRLYAAGTTVKRRSPAVEAVA